MTMPEKIRNPLNEEEYVLAIRRTPPEMPSTARIHQELDLRDDFFLNCNGTPFSPFETLLIASVFDELLNVEGLSEEEKKKDSLYSICQTAIAYLQENFKHLDIPAMVVIMQQQMDLVPLEIREYFE